MPIVIETRSAKSAHDASEFYSNRDAKYHDNFTSGPANSRRNSESVNGRDER
ncbi:hypothetical protein [Bradyrhizobium sp.]|uniref:hypothetical protein n=1 Tax=Bradyrhizobium sp. TaxID=376 RepID=UPI0025BCF23B|nr:hypothetical protein [Bradyrhizobium sp.]